MQKQIAQAAQLRKDNQGEKALELLLALPRSAEVSYQIAWTCDSMGREAEAAPYYEEALAAGLAGDDRRGAFLGLGSTYRCLGEYEKSKAIFDRAIAEFPDERAFKVFYALTLYNLKQHDKSVEILLTQLLDTTSDSGIKSYERVLRSHEIVEGVTAERPDARISKVFNALALYNLKQHDKSVEILLMQLLDTTSDGGIKTYDRALRFYADKLDKTWT